MENNFNDFNKFDDEVLDIEEVTATDLKINPDYYIHNIILKGQAALISQDINSGIMQFIMCTENLEILCRSANKITEDYDKKVQEFRDEQNKRNEEINLKNFRVANKKWELLLTEVFQNKTITQPMRLTTKKP